MTTMRRRSLRTAVSPTSTGWSTGSARQGSTRPFVARGVPTHCRRSLDLCCYRIVEEALTNVTRHSAATTVTVDVDRRRRRHPHRRRRPGTVLARPARAATAGVVLVGMRERVALFDGRLAVGPSLDGGFMVVADLPASDRGVDRRHGARVTVSVVVTDDQPLMRSALATILTGGGIDVVGEAGSGDEAVAVVVAHVPTSC